LGLGEKAMAELAANGWLKPGATLVWEESADAAVTVPEGFALDDERTYGAAAVRFLTFGTAD
jgi:16S rRNA (guanine966-N2)-methyltransferase